MKLYYEKQLDKAKETLEILEQKLHLIRQELKENPIDANKMRDLRNLTLDMTITLNEIENCIDQLKLLKL